MLRTSIVPTILKGGFRTNVIPSEAEATLDVRALPDEDMAKLYEEMKKVINDPAVKIEAIHWQSSACGAFTTRHRNVQGTRSDGEENVPWSDGAAEHVDRRIGHGPVASERDSVIRHRSAEHRK